MLQTDFEHQCTATFKILNEEKATPVMKQALKDLPRLAALVSHETGWPITGEIKINLAEPHVLKNDMRTNFINTHYSEVGLKKISTSYNKKDFMEKLLGLKNKILAGYVRHNTNVIHLLNSNKHYFNPTTQRGIITHELTHIAQDQNTSLVKQRTVAAKSIALAQLKGIDDKKVAKLESSSEKLSMITEGQATYVENKVRQVWTKGLDTEIITNPTHNSKQHTPLGLHSFNIKQSMRKLYFGYEHRRNLDPYMDGCTLYRDTLNNSHETLQELLNSDYLADVQPIIIEIKAKPVKSTLFRDLYFYPATIADFVGKALAQLAITKANEIKRHL
ncbi:MAG: hypothetical protein VX185_00965 [Pseudomonadota bacterium]|nr:hypothetical protein [Pseudomonadota bacterium]